MIAFSSANSRTAGGANSPWQAITEAPLIGGDHRSLLLSSDFLPAFLIGRDLARGDFVKGAALHLPGDAHGDLVACARSPHAKPYGHDATPAPSAATWRRRAGGAHGRKRGAILVSHLPTAGFGLVGGNRLARCASQRVTAQSP